MQHFAAPAGTLDAALRERLPDIEWTTAPGADFIDPSEAAVAAAAALAAENDLVIVAVGEPSSLTGEASSRSDIRLPGDQERLIHAIADTGVPFVVVLATGRPLVVEDWIDRAPSVLLTWHLGSQAPEAIARVLAGDVDPGGRVPMTFPRSVGQIPIHHDHEPTGRPARTGGSLSAERWDVGLQGPNNLDDYYTSKYLDLDLGPRFAFGHGLSYTEFALESVAASAERIPRAELLTGGVVDIRATVRNVGDRDGDDVVFVYVTDPVASVSQPVRRLRGFARMHLSAGATADVAFRLSAEDFQFWTDDEATVLEPGAIVLTVTDGTSEAQFDLDITA